MPLLSASLVAPLGVANVLVFGSLLLAPVGVAVGVLRYRLLGIEAVLRRGVVYGTVTAAVVLAYLLAAATVGAALDSRWLPGAVAAAIAAVGLAPARDRLQRAADRLLYGQRSDPLEAVTLLGKRITAGDELDLLRGALVSVMSAVHAPGASVTGPDGRVLATLGPATEHDTVLPMSFGGREIGRLRVAPRGPGERYGRADLRLLDALALQVAVVVRAVGLTEALEAERDRVLAATTTERDRLRGDLHDGLGPSLSGVGLGLQALGDRVEAGDREASAALLDRITEEVAVAVSEVRRIIDGLRPTALDTLGLQDAIRRHAETVSAAVPVRIAGPGDLARRKVCAARDSTSLDTLTGTGAVPVSPKTYTECVQKLLGGTVDAVSTDNAILLGYAAEQPDKLKVIGTPFTEERYGIGYPHGDHAFCQFLTETVRRVEQDGSWAAAFDRTLGKAGVPRPDPPAPGPCPDE